MGIKSDVQMRLNSNEVEEVRLSGRGGVRNGCLSAETEVSPSRSLALSSRLSANEAAERAPARPAKQIPVANREQIIPPFRQIPQRQLKLYHFPKLRKVKRQMVVAGR